MMAPYKHDFGQEITTDAKDTSCDMAFLAHYKVEAADAVAADTDGVHAAKTCPAINAAASATVEAASAGTDTLTVSSTVAIGAAANALSILLTTAEGNTLAVSKNDPDTDGVINIALANATASKNTATLIQAAIRALSTVNGVDVSAFTCSAGGNWNTAAIATGETEAVDFTGGVTSIDVLTTEITNPAVPRNITAKSGGTAADIGAIQVTVSGTNFNDEEISETLPIFTANSATTVSGSLAFKTVTEISIPAHDGLGATTEIGFGNKFGLPYMLEADELVTVKLFDKAADTGTVTPDADELEKNVFAINGTPDGTKDIDLYIIV